MTAATTTSTDECTTFARFGLLARLRAAREEHGCAWDEETCSWAAHNGHLDCLRYLHDRGCPWSATTCEWAAAGGHLDCLVFAREHGCPWTDATLLRAAQWGKLACLTYAHGRGCPGDLRRCRSVCTDADTFNWIDAQLLLRPWW